MVTSDNLKDNWVPIACIIGIIGVVFGMDPTNADLVFLLVCVFLAAALLSRTFQDNVNWEAVLFTIVLVFGIWFGMVIRNFGSNEIYSIIFLSMSGLIFFIAIAAILSQYSKSLPGLRALGGLTKLADKSPENIEIDKNPGLYYSMYILFGGMIFTVLLLSFVTGTSVPGFPVVSGNFELIILAFYTLMGFSYFMNRIKLLQTKSLFINQLRWDKDWKTFLNFLLSPAYFVFEVFYLFGSVFNFEENIEAYDEKDGDFVYRDQKDCSLTNAKRIRFSLGSYDTGKGANIEFNDSRFIYSFIFITVLISWPLLLCLRNKEKVFAKEGGKITGFSTFFLNNLAYASCYLLLFTVPLVFATVTPVSKLETTTTTTTEDEEL